MARPFAQILVGIQDKPQGKYLWAPMYYSSNFQVGKLFGKWPGLLHKYLWASMYYRSDHFQVGNIFGKLSGLAHKKFVFHVKPQGKYLWAPMYYRSGNIFGKWSGLAHKNFVFQKFPNIFFICACIMKIRKSTPLRSLRLLQGVEINHGSAH